MIQQNIEMLNDFELLYNNITNNQAPGLNIYEISKFLTLAQEEKIKNAFSYKGNKYQEGYDDSIKRQSDFSTLIDTIHLLEETVGDYTKFDRRSRVFLIPEDVFLVLNEQIVEYNVASNDVFNYGNFYTVIPLSYDEYSKEMQKPYKYPPRTQVWKLATSYNNGSSNSTSSQVVEIIGKFQDGYELEYSLRYVKRPTPIVLDNLSTLDENLSIEGKSTETTCMLSKHLRSEIVYRAVELAKLAWMGDINASIQAEERSE